MTALGPLPPTAAVRLVKEAVQDAYADYGSEASRWLDGFTRQGGQVFCGAGCFGCCNMPIRLSLAEARARGPYGECVYAGKNNVNDHEAVTVEFTNGVVAQLTVSAFTHNNTRTLKLLGTHGELRAQMEAGELEWHDFRSGQVEREWAHASGNHGGGDAALVAAWLRFLRGEGPVPTPLAESLDSHRMAFAAERSGGNSVWLEG